MYAYQPTNDFTIQTRIMNNQVCTAANVYADMFARVRVQRNNNANVVQACLEHHKRSVIIASGRIATCTHFFVSVHMYVYASEGASM